MLAPVWILSVDLQTKTATFQSGMADAARSARSAFKDIQDGASGMGEGVNRGSLDVRHALGLVDNTIRGAHSMAMVDLIRMFKDSALVMGALPFAMTAAGFALVAELVVKGVQAFNEYRQAEEKIKDASTQMHTTIQEVFNGLDDKIIEAQKQADELSGNHLAALRRQLELIDHQSMTELAHSFDTVTAAAYKLFGDLKASWYEMGIGSDGAKHALDEFKVQYESLLAQGKDKEASDLLAGTRQSAEKTLAAMQFVKNNMPTATVGGAWQPDEKTLQYYRDANTIKAAGVGTSDREVQSVKALVDTLIAQQEVEQKIAALKRDEAGNARTQAAKEMSRDDNSTASKVAAGRALMMKDLSEQYKEEVQTIQDGERLVIDTTKEGTAERLQAIEDAMSREEADGLQGTEFYKSLAIEKLEIQRELGDQQTAQSAALAREQADSDAKMAELRLSAEKQHQELLNSAKAVSLEMQVQQAKQFADEEYNVKMSALQNEIEGLNRTDQQYLVNLRKLQDQESQLIRQHENEIAAIREKAEIETNQKLSASYQQFTQTIAGSMSQLITGHQTLAKTFENLGDQMIGTAIKNAIMYALSNKARQESDARAAASAGFKLGMEIGGPAAPILAPVLAATAFAGALAFEMGTDRVPGIGRGDIVPAMLTPGEGVVPGGVMDGLRNVARNGGFDGGGPHYHVTTHVHMQASALDSDGVDKVFTKHADTIQKHFERALRRTNR